LRPREQPWVKQRKKLSTPNGVVAKNRMAVGHVTAALPRVARTLATPGFEPESLRDPRSVSMKLRPY